MAKPQKRPAQPSKNTRAGNATAPEANTAGPGLLNNVRLQGLLFFVLAFVMYANTLGHGFVIDDKVVITDNVFTKQGIGGLPEIFSTHAFEGFQQQGLVYGNRYRPLTVGFFAILYEFFGAKPWVYHLFTVLSFAAVVLLLHRTLLLLFRQFPDKKQAYWMAGLATLLFTVHPVHTEVVANIKSCDELAALAGGLGALYLVLRAFDTGRMAHAWLAALVLLAGMLGKENAITFLAVVPAALWMFRGATAAQVWRYTWPALLAGLTYIVLRAMMVGWSFGQPPMDLMNNPYVKLEGTHWVRFTSHEWLASVVFCLGKYIWLLVVPHPLTSDYYPRHIGIVTFSDVWVWVGLLLHLALVVFALWSLFTGKAKTAGFGAIVYLASMSIVCNLFFPIGTNMAERFLFMPSLGFCLAAAALWAKYSPKISSQPYLKWGIAAAVVLPLAILTFQRNQDWASNLTLFTQDIKTSPNSAKMNYAYGAELCELAISEKDPAKRQQLLDSSLHYQNVALEIYPISLIALYMRGNAYLLLNQYDQAAKDYRYAVQLNPNYTPAANNLALSLREAAKALIAQQGDLQKILEYLQEAQKYFDKDPEILGLLGQATLRAGQPAEAIQWLNKLLEVQPNNTNAIYTLAQAYAMTGNTTKAEEIMQRARSMNPAQ